MKYKIVDVTGVESPTYTFDVERNLNKEFQDGWKLYGSLIVIPESLTGGHAKLWQPMIKDDEDEDLNQEAWEVMQGIANSCPEDDDSEEAKEIIEAVG